MTPVDSDEEDLTRKQRRDQARQQRKELEEEEASRAVRRKRMTQLAIAVTVVVVAVVVIAIAAGGGGGSKAAPKQGSSAEKQAVSTVNATLSSSGGKQIPQNGNVLGNPNAPVTLVYFGDLQCPICKDFTLGALPKIIQQWVASGKLRIEYRSLETATREPEVFKEQQVAALAAGAQAKMWNYLELFYHEQGEESSGYVTEAYLQSLARQAGLNMATWSADRNKAEYSNQVAADAQAANNQGFNGTPSFLIGTTGGALKKLEYQSLTDPSSFNQAIESLQPHA
jgi:protein-disulfide isomerase